LITERREQEMQGTVLDYSIQSNSGAVSGDDGHRYNFDGGEWRGNDAPRAGLRVDFVGLDSTASEVYPVQGQSSSIAGGGKSKITAGILGILLGGLGAHKFYLGYGGAGGIMLALWISGLLFMFLGIGLLWVWIPGLVGLIEGIIYLTKNDYDFEQVYVVGNRPWF